MIHFLALFGLSFSFAASGPCSEDSRFQVEYKELNEKIAICEGVRRAQTFFKEQGLDCGTTHFSFHFKTYDEGERDPDILEVVHALTDLDTGEILMPTLKRFLGAKAPLFPDALPRGIEPNVELYASIAAHEAAHVLAHHANSKFPDSVPVEQQEFIGYVTQFATMHPKLREIVVEGFLGKASWTLYDEERDITKAAMMFRDIFALKSYLFFQTTEIGNGLLRRYINREVPARSGQIFDPEEGPGVY